VQLRCTREVTAKSNDTTAKRESTPVKKNKKTLLPGNNNSAYFGSPVFHTPHPAVPQFKLSAGVPSTHDHPVPAKLAVLDWLQPTYEDVVMDPANASRPANLDELPIVNRWVPVGHRAATAEYDAAAFVTNKHE
jgi:hypothetical protein